MKTEMDVISISARLAIQLRSSAEFPVSLKQGRSRHRLFLLSIAMQCSLYLLCVTAHVNLNCEFQVTGLRLLQCFVHAHLI